MFRSPCAWTRGVEWRVPIPSRSPDASRDRRGSRSSRRSLRSRSSESRRERSRRSAATCAPPRSARRAIDAEALAASRLEFMDLLTDRELQALPDSVETGKFPAPLEEYSWKTTSTPLSDQAASTTFASPIDWATGTYACETYQYRRPPLVTRR